MWELYHKEGWVLKNWCFQTVVLEKTLESPLDSKEIKSVNPKGNQPWIFIGRTDDGTPILWPPKVKSWLTGKDPDAGKDQEGQKGDRGWDGWMDPSSTQWTWTWAKFMSKGQGGLACCSLWGCKESDTTGWLNRTTLSEARTLHEESKAAKNRRHARKTSYAWDFPSVSAKNPTSQETAQTQLTSMVVHLWLGLPDKIQDTQLICISDK